MKSLALVAVPAGVVTVIFPVDAPAGTVAVILPDMITVKGAGLPLNWTDVAPVKFAPLIVTLAPTAPLVGTTPVMRGATVKFAELVPVPPGVVTLMGPVMALAGTVAVILVAKFTLKAADMPLNLTDVAPVKVVPVIVTLVPTAPPVGVKLVTSGLTLKLAALIAVPAGVVTPIFPVVAPAGTIAVILFDAFTVKVDDVPFHVTAVAPVKLDPLIVTLAPTTPLPGEKPVIRGATVNVPGLVAVPAAFATLTVPVMALGGTVAVI